MKLFLNNKTALKYFRLFLLIYGLIFSSCKKDKSSEDKASTTAVTPPAPASTSETYVIQNYNSNSFNVDDTIQLITASSGILKLTIPVNYGLDTMTLAFDSAITSTTSVYSFNHVVKNNNAYHLVGNVYRNASPTFPYFNLLFAQRISPYGVDNGVQQYNLQYVKL